MICMLLQVLRHQPIGKQPCKSVQHQLKVRWDQLQVSFRDISIVLLYSAMHDNYGGTLLWIKIDKCARKLMHVFSTINDMSRFKDF